MLNRSKNPQDGDQIWFLDCIGFNIEFLGRSPVFPFPAPENWSSTYSPPYARFENQIFSCGEIVIGNQTVGLGAAFCLSYHSNLTAPDDAWDTARYNHLAAPLQFLTDFPELAQVLEAWGMDATLADISVDPAGTGFSAGDGSCNSPNSGFRINYNHTSTNTEDNYAFPSIIRLVTEPKEVSWISLQKHVQSHLLTSGEVTATTIGTGTVEYWGDSPFQKWPVQAAGKVLGGAVHTAVEAEWTLTYRGTGVS